MKRSNTYYNILRKAGVIAASLVAFAALPLTLTGCATDSEANAKSIYDYKDDDVKSYADLFEVFWNVMDQRYCALNEQGISSLDWNQVYGEYKPKFAALKSFTATSEFTLEEIQSDNAKAKQYFKEIIDKILDQHFRITITLPVSHASTESVTIRSSLRERDDKFPLSSRWNFTKSLLKDGNMTFEFKSPEGFCMIGGFLKSDPEVYYLSFSNFRLTENCQHTYRKEYLPTYEGSTYHLSRQTIVDKVNELVSAQDKREKVASEATTLLDSMNNYFASDAVTAACKKMVAFSNGGDYYGMVEQVQKAENMAPGIVKRLPRSTEVDDISRNIQGIMDSDANCATIRSEAGFSQWLCTALAEYLLHEREFYAFWSDVEFTTDHSVVEFYQRCFMEPLKEGKIKKLLLDLRSNTGGYVADTRLITDYLVSHTATFCYMRMKENDNPYGYSPWVPQQIVVTPNSLKRDIPTAILIDNWSASMGEVTPLMLKSQGDHIKLIGRNTFGAQCMLTENANSNGGWTGNVTRYLNFYMPCVMTKDTHGNILESVGLAPDYKVERMTNDEITKIYQAASDAKDRDMEKALEVLRQ